MNNKNATANSDSTKKLAFISIFLLGINGIIGSGTFLLPQEIYQNAGVLWGVITILFAGISTTLIAMCYADQSGRFSESGGAWLYSYHAFGKFVGFQVGFFSWFAGVVAISAEIAALIRIFKTFVPALSNEFLSLLFGIVLIAILGIINLSGLSFVKVTSNVSSACKIGAALFFIVTALFFLKKVHFEPLVPEKMKSTHGLFSGLTDTYSTVFYMFTGFSFLPIAARKMKNPQKNLPKALISIMLSVTFIYTAVQLLAVGVLGPELAKTTIPVALAMKKMLGEWGYAIIIIGSSISTFGVAFTSSFDVPYLASSLANEHNLLPKFFGKENKRKTPYVGIILTMVVSACLLTTGSYVFLAQCMVCANFVQYIPVIFACMVFRKKKIYPSMGFKLPGGYTIPVLAFISSLYLLVSFNWKVILVAVIVFIVGWIIYLIQKKYGEPEVPDSPAKPVAPSTNAQSK